jgi:hypothetical protein
MDTLDRIRNELIETFLQNHGAVTHHHGMGKLFSKFLDPEHLRVQKKLEDPLFGGV